MSRDINHIYEQKKKSQKKYGNKLFLEVQNILAGLVELIKKSWTIVDDPKTDQKERMKAISLILQCYNRRFELVRFEPEANEIKEYIENIIKKEKQLDAKEKIIEALREGTKLSWSKLALSLDEDRVF